MILASTRLEEVLLALKIAFLVLLYLMIWRIIRTVSRDMRVQPAQESFIMAPVAGGVPSSRSQVGGRLVVLESPVLDEGDEYSVDSAPLTVGRGGQNDVAIDGDEFASARHVRFEPRRDGVWVQDLGSTNGTLVNGVRIDGRAPARARRRRPRGRDRPEVRAMSRVGAYAAKTDTGRKRRRNEDAFVLAPPLFAVADGMGGAQAGEVASKLAAAALEDTDAGRLTGPAKVASLIQEANRRVHERSSSDPTTSGMGTTMTVALVEDGGVVIGHVGDSRAYLVRDGQIEQITEDHSLVNELLKSGKLSSVEADTHPQRSVITRAVGTDPDVDVDSFIVEPQDGDVFLICSDGLTDMVTDTRSSRRWSDIAATSTG